MRTNAVEAAEQCGILTIPEIAQEISLASYVTGRSPERLLVFCDEEADVSDPITSLRDVKNRIGEAAALALLIGPEGGFDAAERNSLLAAPNVLPISLGPRILRADTAAVAGLALLQAVLGDWRGVQPPTTMSP
jgi:16S rRNA (uracil1498-N3)-methyltransferase